MTNAYNNFKTAHLNEKQKINLRTIQNVKEQKVKSNNDSNIHQKTITYMCMYNHTV